MLLMLFKKPISIISKVVATTVTLLFGLMTAIFLASICFLMFLSNYLIMDDESFITSEENFNYWNAIFIVILIMASFADKFL